MTGLLLAIAGGYGTYLLYTALAFGWRGGGMGPGARAAATRARRRRRLETWLAQAGLDQVRPMEFGAVVAVLFLVGAGLAWSLFGGIFPALAAGAFAVTFPPASYRARRRARRAAAQDAWPRMIEEIRILTGSLGRSIPQALFEVGRRSPPEMHAAFGAAHRQWLLSTDFDATLAVLKARLADATADAACETLLIAHELGGSDLDRRLDALAEDRRQDAQGRKDARSKQAGARFARKFVIVVPVGMAMAGLSVGTGREAYRSALGQVAVVTAIAMIVVCWLWAGAIMRLPDEERVFQ